MLLEQLDAIARFLESGGIVLWLILLVALVLWTLIIERYWYQRRVFPRELAAFRAQPSAPTGVRGSWRKTRVLRKEVSRFRHRLGSTLFLIRTLILICPLLGLLGTVTGMIQLFEVMGFSGTGDPRAMAGGVSRATIPTMAGLVVAISGFYFSSNLQRSADKLARRAEETLRRRQP